jgi:APA family basic amino acid/polyamine antiporter
MSTEDIPQGGTPPPAISDTIAGAGLFVRRSSGLVREMGFRDAFSIAITFTNFGSIALIYYLTFSLFPGADVTLPLILAALVSALLTVVYAQLIAAMPRSGADYVYGARVVSPVFGAWIGGILLWTWVLVIGFAAVTIAELFTPFMLTGVGHAVGWHGLQTAGANLAASKTAEFCVGAGLVLAGGLYTMLGARAVGRLLFWGFVIGLVTLILIVIECLTHSQAQFAIAYNKSIGHPNAFANVLAAGRKNGVPTTILVAATFAATPYIIQQYTGFSAANFSGGELKRPARTFMRSVMAVLVFATAAFVVCWLALRHLVGVPFLQAAGTLSTNDASVWAHVTGSASPLVQFYAFVVTGSPVIQFILAAGFAVAFAVIIPAQLQVFSRIVFAMSFDRLLPTKLADVNPRTHSPLKSIVLGIVFGILVTYLAVFSSTYVDLARNLTLVFQAIFVLASGIGMVFPWRKHALYASTPKIVSGSWFGYPPIAVISAFSLVVNLFLLALFASKAQTSGGYDATSIVGLALVAVTGLAIYATAKFSLSRRGLDLDLTMAELPPE